MNGRLWKTEGLNEETPKKGEDDKVFSNRNENREEMSNTGNWPKKREYHKDRKKEERKDVKKN